MVRVSLECYPQVFFYLRRLPSAGSGASDDVPRYLSPSPGVRHGRLSFGFAMHWGSAARLPGSIPTPRRLSGIYQLDTPRRVRVDVSFLAT